MVRRAQLPSRKLAAAAALSGLLLFLSDYPVHCWPLQAIALIPLLRELSRPGSSVRAAAWAGLLLGLFYTVPLSVFVALPWSISVILDLYLSLLWVLIAIGAHYGMRDRSVLGALFVGAVGVVVEWADFNLLPMWGTAQCFARVWSACPEAIQVVSLTGVTGMVFLLLTSQALVVKLALVPTSRKRTAAALAALLGVVLIWGMVRWHRKPAATIRVAAIGWLSQDFDRLGYWGAPNKLFNELYAPLVRQAAAQGVSLVVSPEVGFWLWRNDRPAMFERYAKLARSAKIALAVGYFDKHRNDNRIAFFGPDGKLRGEYRKTHLIAFFENYRAGDGELVVFDHGGVSVGGMICQDDNFTDLARAHGQQAVQVVAVPTNDWQQVKDYHFENSIFRTVENDYGIVRAASNGISAIVSARGEILASCDHFERGPEVIVADLPVYGGRTIYSRLGAWLPACSALGLLATVIVRRRRKRSLL